MKRLLIAGKIHREGLALLDQSGLEVDYIEDTADAAFVPHLAHAEALILRTQTLNAPRIAAAPSLKLVVRHGVGFDAVDGQTLAKRGIPLAIIGDVLSGAVAEQAMMMILALSRRAIAADKAVRDGDWGWRNGLFPREIRGKNLLLVGYGRIGQRLARLANAFGMVIRAVDPALPAEAWQGEPATAEVSLQSGLTWADVVSLHAPPVRKPVIRAAELALMKSDALLINTARGGLIDEAALCEALQVGRLGGVGLDVFEQEPLPTNAPILTFERVLTSPHNASLTEECAARMAVASVQNVLDHMSGRLDPSLVVNGVDSGFH